jgi:hypothetical protein
MTFPIHRDFNGFQLRTGTVAGDAVDGMDASFAS